MRDYFTSEADLTPYAARPRQVALRTNLKPEEAPNEYLRRAGELSEHLNLSTFDEAGENLGRVLWLVHAGDELERTKTYAIVIACLVVGALLAGGVVIGRRRLSRAS